MLQVSLVTWRYFASGGSYQEVCGELNSVVQDRPVQSPPFISSLLLGAFRYPTDGDFRSNPTSYFIYDVCPRLLFGSERIERSNATFSNKTLSLSHQSLPFTFSCVSWFLWLSRKWKAQRKSQNQRYILCSRRPTASSRQSAASQHRVFDVICNALSVKQRIFPYSHLKTNTSD